MKNLKKILACLLTAGLVAGLSALSVSAEATRYEAEDATLNDQAQVRTSDDGLSSVWNLDSGNTTITVTVNVAEAGEYDLNVATICADLRWVRVIVNGNTDAPVDFEVASNGTWGEGAGVVSTETTVKVTLNAGDNEIVVTGQPDKFGPGIDYISVDAAAATDAPETDAPETDAPETDAPVEDDKPAQTGDAAIAAVAVAVLAIAGVAVVSKKRYSAE